MTSPVLFTLSLALVCSITGIISEQIADYENMQSNMKGSDVNDFAVQVNTWTNKYILNYINNIGKFNKISFNNVKIQKPDKNNLETTEKMEIRIFDEKNKESHNRYSEVYKRDANVKKDKDKKSINVNKERNNKIIYIEDITNTTKLNKFDKAFKSEENILERNLRMHKVNIQRYNERHGIFDSDQIKRRVKRDDDPRCGTFKFDPNVMKIMHPHGNGSSTYYNNTSCVTVINATDDKQIIELTFIDIFRIEYHPQCGYDYLEIRDGLHGYANLLGKLCGEAFPRQIRTTGPVAWLKFYSDDTIEYEGFKIEVEFKNGEGHSIPESCFITKNGPDEDQYGVIDSKAIPQDCLTGSSNHPLDVLWKIETAHNTKIYLNFTTYYLEKPNECDHNVVQVFGSVIELDSMLVQYCGSVANSVTTKGEAGKDGKNEKGNIMYVRMYASKAAKAKTQINATYNAFRVIQAGKDTDRCNEDEFNCEDNTCIAQKLTCDGSAHCRLKADEEKTLCEKTTKSILQETHIVVILVIFSLILSGMSFVFIFKCIRKLYQDHKLITEHFKQSCEDRLDSLHSSRLTLDPKRLQRDSEPRASLERENHTNEMYKKQRSFSKHEQSSRESDFIEETRLDLDDDPWRREVDSVPIEEQDVKIERNGRTRRSDISRKEESIRSKTKESENSRTKKEIRDVSVGAPDTKESGCQTRESLFQTEPPLSSDGSGSNSRGFSTFGYSGATIVRPSPPNQTKTSEITIELLKQVPPQESKPQKKIADRRPISTETTRSAPDVIIVSKPIR